MVDVYKAPEAELTKKASSNEYGSIKIGTSGAYSFRIRKVFSEAWKLVKGAKLPFFIAFVIYFICYIGLSFLSTTIAAVFGFEIPSPFDTELSADFNPVSVGIGQLIVVERNESPI